MASVKSISIRDFTANSALGKLAEVVNVTLTLDEAVTATNGTINGNTVLPTLMVGGRPLPVSAEHFLEYNPKAKTLTYQVPLPEGLSGNPVTLTALTVSDITINGVKGPSLVSKTNMALTAKYTVDSIRPTFDNTSNSVTTFSENSATTLPVLTAAARDNSGSVSYSLGGTDASAFKIDKLGVLRFKAIPDFESKSLYQVNIHASDKAGNVATQAYTVNIRDVDETVILKKGIKGTGTLTFAKGNLLGQAINIGNDFVQDGSSTNTYNLSGLAGVSITRGLLDGTITSPGQYKVLVTSNDNIADAKNAKDASRAYVVKVLNQPDVVGLKVSDGTGASLSGKLGDSVKLEVQLSEPLTNADLTKINANFMAGKSPLSEVAYTGLSADKKQLNFVAKLPAGDSSNIVLTALDLGSNVLRGSFSNNTLSGSMAKLKLTGSYALDNKAPVITSGASVTINENPSLGAAFYTAKARDVNAVRFSLTGDQASFFHIDPDTGRLSAAKTLDYEALKNAKYQHQVTLVATDANQLSSQKVLRIRLRDVNEKTEIVNNDGDLTNYNLYKNVELHQYMKTGGFEDPEGKAITYRISDGWLPNGLSLNSKTGIISGIPTTTGVPYKFTITADDGKHNGKDASRQYSGLVTDEVLLSADNTILTNGHASVRFTVKGKFTQAGQFRLYKEDGDGSPAKQVMTIDSPTPTNQFDWSVNKEDLGLASNQQTHYFVHFVGTNVEYFSTLVNIARIDAIALDDIKPSISHIDLSSADAINQFLNTNDVLTATVTFSEAVSLQGNPTISVDVGGQAKPARFVSQLNSSVAQFVYTIAAGDTDSNGVAITATSVDLAGGSIVDLANNAANLASPTLAAQAHLKVDTTAPILSGLSMSSGNSALAIGSVVTVMGTFNESIAVTGQPTVGIDIGGTTRNASYAETTSNSVAKFYYTIQAGDTDSDGISVPAGSITTGITDLAGNAAVTTHSGVSNVASVGNPTITIDGVSPSLRSLSLSAATGAQNSLLNAGDVATVSATFSEAIQVSTNATISLDIGGVSRAASFSSISNNSVAHYVYTVRAGDNDSDGISIPANSVSTGVRDLVGNAATVGHTLVAANSSFLVDTRAPSVSAVNVSVPRAAENGFFNVVTNDVIGLLVDFDETVSASSVPALRVNIGGVHRSLTFHSIVNNTRAQFTYTVVAGDKDTDGISVVDTLMGSSITDRAGNSPANTPVCIDGITVKVNPAAPQTSITGAIGMSSSSSVTNSLMNENDVVTANVTFSDAIAITGKPSIQLQVGGASRPATFDSVSNSSVANLIYTITAGDNDDNGISVNPGAIALGSSGSIVDSNNTAVLLDYLALTDQDRFKVDTVKPTLNSIALSATGRLNNWLNPGDVLTLSGTFSETLGWVTTVSADVVISSSRRSMAFSNISNGSVANFIYTIQAGDDDSNGISVPANSITGSLFDRAGNLAVVTHTGIGDDNTFKVDTLPPPVPTISFVDNGPLTNDSRTSDSVVTVGNLQDGFTWQYQINDKGEWFTLTSKNFYANAGDNTYVARQVDAAGNISKSVPTRIVLETPVKGFVITGQGASDYSGSSVAGAGDVNGDGLADVIIGAPEVDVAGISNAGRSYVLFGSPTTRYIELSSIAVGSGGFVINGQGASNEAGTTVAAAGDVNGDGLADLMVSEINSTNLSGRSYVVFGKTDGSAVALSNILTNASGGFAIRAADSLDGTGYSLSSAGDVNGDGLADVLVGAFNGSTSDGKAFLVFGKADTTAVLLSNVALGSGGFLISPANSNDGAGVSVSGAGDVNGDGLADIIVGALNDNRAYVIFSQRSPSAVQLTAIAAGSGGFVVHGECAGDELGSSVSSAGDVNGDGLADLVIGAPQSSNPTGQNSAGRSYVVFGKTTNTAIQLSAIANQSSSAGFVMYGESQVNFLGFSVAAAGDVNGDGMADVIVGAPLLNAFGSFTPAPNRIVTTGRSYIIFGKTSNTAIDLRTVGTATGLGFEIDGEGSRSTSGYSVSGAGDVNGDGLADLIVGAPKAFADPLRVDSGRTYLVLGKTDNTPVQLSYGNVNYGYTWISNTPSAADDHVVGTTASEILLGAAGNDTITGGGGTDVLLGGLGNDILIVNASNISALMSNTPILSDTTAELQLARVDGGSGIDTLRLMGTASQAANLDLTQLSHIAAGNTGLGSRITSIEKIDLLSDSNANRLTLNAVDVLDIVGLNLVNITNGWSNVSGSDLSPKVAKHQLVIRGNASDTVDISEPSVTGTSGWTQGGTVSDGADQYQVWNHNSVLAQLIIQQGVVVI